MDDKPKGIRMQLESDPRFIKKSLQDAFTTDLENIEKCIKNNPMPDGHGGTFEKVKKAAEYQALKDAAKRYMSLLTNLGVM